MSAMHTRRSRAACTPPVAAARATHPRTADRVSPQSQRNRNVKYNIRHKKNLFVRRDPGSNAANRNRSPPRSQAQPTLAGQRIPTVARPQSDSSLAKRMHSGQPWAPLSRVPAFGLQALHPWLPETGTCVRRPLGLAPPCMAGSGSLPGSVAPHPSTRGLSLSRSQPFSAVLSRSQPRWRLSKRSSRDMNSLHGGRFS